jgi:inositol hexakisphosphate/diphosphoinositol-pentakisphosphate kinase
LADSDTSLPRIVIGICAMEKKARSKPMQAIVERLHAFGEFEVEVFGDAVTLHQPITEWPVVDVLLSWHSEGFPLDKVRRWRACFAGYQLLAL